LDINQVGLKKIDEEKTRRVDPATRSKTRLQLVNFFLLKRHHFDFFLKKMDVATQSKLKTGVEPDQI
jgi:hypothetical protein